MSEYEPQKGDMIRVQGNREYLPVAARVQWFRGDHPAWTIDTAVVELDFASGYAVMRAEVRDDTGRIIAAGTKTETRKGFGDFVEKAETGAVGRALARAGYGTEDALDLEGDRYADAPIQQPEGGERVPDRMRSGGAARATTRPPAQRTPEEQRLLDELLAVTGMTKARMTLLADAAGVPKGERANAEQLREMLRIAHTPIESPASPATSAPPVADAAAPAAPGEAGSSVPASPSNAGSAGMSDPATTPAAVASPPPSPESVPSMDDILAAAGPGAEEVPPKPGTDPYRALPAHEKARARAYWQDHKEPEQASLAEALGGPASD